MSLSEAHLWIAKERFLEMMAAHPDGEPRLAAIQAIEQADAFTAAYGSLAPVQLTPKLKGCKACYGSGGKANQPCKACMGEGKVPA